MKLVESRNPETATTDTDVSPTVSLDVAVVHDWMPVLVGGERVVEQIVGLCPNSTLYTLFDFLSEEERAIVAQGRPIHVSRLNSMPFVRKYYRYLLLPCTRAIEAFDVTRHDLVISSSAALAKGVITSPSQKHISYVHSPARYAWDLTHEYLASIGGAGASLKRWLAHRMMYRFRMWDMRTPQSVDCFVANSHFIRRRIWKAYRREAEVIYPSVDISAFTPGTAAERGDHYLTVSRLVPYKRVAMIVEAFNHRPHLKIRVVGHGPEAATIRAMAGPNVEILGHLPFDVVRQEMRQAKAFISAAMEDFGISPVEAQASGTPVIALGLGGTAETIRPLGTARPTGIWFHEQTVESLLDAIDAFEAEGNAILAEDCRANAETFGPKRFRRELAALIGRVAS